MRDSYALKLHFSQLKKSWEKSKFNKYSDTGKQKYQDQLVNLFNCLKDDDFDNLSPSQIHERITVIEFFFRSIDFLDFSTVNQFPFEIIFCLEKGLRDWLDDHHKYLIVTSLVNDYFYGYSFDPTLALYEKNYDVIRNVYKLEFESRLIQINLPKCLTRDYLANAVLFHELGHFVDQKYQISKTIAYELVNIWRGSSIDPLLHSDITKYFVYDFTSHPYNKILENHLGEYISDIFAAQYVGQASYYFLQCISDNPLSWSSTHPTDELRVNLVDDFLNDNPNQLLELIKSTVLKITGNKIFTKRFGTIDTSQIFRLLPHEIKSDSELFSMFSLAWLAFMDEHNEMQLTNNIKFNLKPSKRYEIVNNLIEKSIGNYIVTSKWEIHKNVSN